MTNAAVPFPDVQPPGYDWLEDEPVFNPSVHLALEAPSSLVSLKDLGYGDEEIKTKASTVAASSPFRVLSAEGAAVLLDSARRLRSLATSNERIENMVRGACYRSKFLRDLCLDPSLTELMCEIYGADVAPHTMPVHLGHINYAPDDLSRAVDKWHHDTLPLDFVMMVTDPAKVDGGEFEYFMGTRHEMTALAAEGKTPPRDRVVAPEFGGPGYAIALHGNMVVHRAAGVRTACERISMVNGYVSTDTARDDQHRHRDLRVVDDPEVLYTEWAKHAAWRARGRLDHLLEELEFGVDRKAVASALEAAVADVTEAIEDMRDDGEPSLHHYEDADS